MQTCEAPVDKNSVLARLSHTPILTWLLPNGYYIRLITDPKC